MNSWGEPGSPNSTSWRHDDHPALPHTARHQASQPFPFPDGTAATAGYLVSQQALHPLTCASRQPVGNDDTSQPSSPRQHNVAGAHQWLPRHQHPTDAIATPWPWAPTFAPPSPPPSSWAVPTGGGIPDVSSGGGTNCTAGVAGCMHVARRAGCKVAGAGRNFVLSPLSLHAALTLVAGGADGHTRRELLGFLGTESLDELRRAAATELVGARDLIPQTSFACGVWVDRRWALRPEFAEAAGAVYAAVVEPVDFVSQAELARQRVNAFVSHATNGLIAAVLPPGSVDASTVLVLANALYFKGTWAQPFERSRTIHATLHLPTASPPCARL